MGRIRNLFAIAKRAVDAELNNGLSPEAPGQAGHGRARHGSGVNQPADGQAVRYATTSQVRAIRAIGNRQGVDAVKLANERFRVNDLEELTLREASSLIDELKSNGSLRSKGGGR